jgi:hypothetical protein
MSTYDLITYLQENKNNIINQFGPALIGYIAASSFDPTRFEITINKMWYNNNTISNNSPNPKIIFLIYYYYKSIQRDGYAVRQVTYYTDINDYKTEGIGNVIDYPTSEQLALLTLYYPTYDLITYLHNNKNNIINQFTDAYNSRHLGNFTLVKLINLWYTTNAITNNSDTHIVTFIAYYQYNAGYYSTTATYDTKSNQYPSSAFDGPQVGTGASATNSGISNEQLALLTLYYPTYNICFPAGTPISTDSGDIVIEELNPELHTINNKKIKLITKTCASLDEFLVCFEKNSLYPNYPKEKTIMSSAHKILYKNQMIEAYKFLGKNKVTKIIYTGETLYNILMEKYDRISVNNLICETLCNNNITKMYN